MVQGDLHLEGDLGTTSVDMKDPDHFWDLDGIDPLSMAHGVLPPMPGACETRDTLPALLGSSRTNCTSARQIDVNPSPETRQDEIFSSRPDA